MSLHVKSADVPERKVVRTGVEGEGAMVVRRGYGNECSLMYASKFFDDLTVQMREVLKEAGAKVVR